MVGLVALPNGFILEAEYEETIGRFCHLYRRRFCTFCHVLFHRFRSALLSWLYFLGTVDYSRPLVRMCHLYSILNHLRVPPLWVDLSLKLEMTRVLDEYLLFQPQ